MSVKLHKLKISEVIKETKDAVTIKFEIPDELKELYRYKQGQFLAFQVNINGENFRREYSLCSSPYYNEPLAISAKKVEGGKVSQYMYHNIKAGDILEVFPPQGKFYTELDPANEKTYMLTGGGSGITPLFSILKSVLKEEPKSKVILYYGNYSEEDIIFKETLERLKQENPKRFMVYHTFISPAEKGSGFKGMINKDDLYRIIYGDISSGKSEAEYFICGPTQMMELVKQALLEINIPKEKIHIEYFASPAPQTTEAVVEKQGGDIEVEESEIITRDVKVILDGVETIVTVEPDKCILEAAMDAGLDPPYSCRSGICTTCRAKLHSGKVKMDEREGLSDSEIEEGFILTCQSHPLTDDTVVEYD